MNIYGLYSTRDEVLRDVGKTSNVAKRLPLHISGDGTGEAEKDEWIAQEVAAGYSIKAITLLEQASPAFDEQRFLDVYNAARGHGTKQLFNKQWATHSNSPVSCKPGTTHGSYTSENAIIADIAREKGLSIKEATRERVTLRNEAQAARGYHKPM